MTIEEVAEFATLVSNQIDNHAPWFINDQDGNRTAITDRELAALTVGLNAINCFVTMAPPKPLAEFTIGDVFETAKSIVASYVDTLNHFGLLQPQEPAQGAEGDGSGTEA